MARQLSGSERDLICLMLSGTHWSLPNDSQVEDMSDGGMGGLRFVSSSCDRKFGAEISSAQFTDSDGVLVSATINVDQHGQIFELDLWKVDFSPLCRIPPISEIEISN